jgi:hypothetical protein
MAREKEKKMIPKIISGFEEIVFLDRTINEQKKVMEALTAKRAAIVQRFREESSTNMLSRQAINYLFKCGFNEPSILNIPSTSHGVLNSSLWRDVLLFIRRNCHFKRDPIINGPVRNSLFKRTGYIVDFEFDKAMNGSILSIWLPPQGKSSEPSVIYFGKNTRGKIFCWIDEQGKRYFKVTPELERNIKYKHYEGLQDTPFRFQ